MRSSIKMQIISVGDEREKMKDEDEKDERERCDTRCVVMR